ncbi:MAG: DUF3052 family protein [Myxococcaceae bacterium]
MSLVASLAVMLGIRSGSKVSVINPPSGFVQKLNPLPDSVEFVITAASGLDVILFFTSSMEELRTRLPAFARAMALTGSIWVCWPHGDGLRSTLSEAEVRQAALDLGMVDNKLAELDPIWSGLRLVFRPRGRPEKPSSRQPIAEA